MGRSQSPYLERIGNVAALSRTQRQRRNASVHRRAKQPTSSEVEKQALRPDLSGTVLCVASTGPRRVRRSAEWRPYRAKFGFPRADLQVTLDGRAASRQ